MQRPEIEQALKPLSDASQPISNRLARLQVIRAQAPGAGALADEFLLRAIDGHAEAVGRAAARHKELAALLEEYTSASRTLATVIEVTRSARLSARVCVHNTQKVVSIASAVDAGALLPGVLVELDEAQRVVVAVSGFAELGRGELARFEEALPDGRILVRAREELLAIGLAPALAGVAFEPGDRVRFDAETRLARERLRPGNVTREFAPRAQVDVPRDRLGGMDDTLARLVCLLSVRVQHPELARRYGLDPQRAILLAGPPGTGKTLLTSVAASEVRRRAGCAVHILNVRPGQMESPYVGETERRIRDLFASAHRTLRDHGGLVVLYFDEIDAIAQERGHLGNHHADSFLGALLAEVDGFDAKCDGTGPGPGGMVLVAATNRVELLDPALVSRMDTQLHVPRPDREAARGIFGVHLPPHLPYGEDRNELIERATGRLYLANGDNRVCTVRLRDGSARDVSTRDLASGRLISQVCLAAKQAALVRAVEGDGSLTSADLDDAIADVVVKLGHTLSARNVRAYVDLPQDQDVVAVEPVARRVLRPHRYLQIA